MNMPDGTSSVLAITAPAVEKYLLMNGWHRDSAFKNRNLMVFIHDESTKKIAIPSKTEFDDFYIILQEVLPTISGIEKKDIRIILKEMQTVYSDRIEFRIISDRAKDGKLPLEYASSCIEGLKELVLYSACAEGKAQPVCFKATKGAKNLLETFKMAQTEVGSFIINIDIQVVDESMDEQLILENCPIPRPFEHKVVERIHTAMVQINAIVDEKQQLSIVAETAYKTGITANMCEALLKIKPNVGDAQIGTTIHYASAITRKSSAEKQIVFGDHHFLVLDELAKMYRDRELFQDVVLNGIVKSLSIKDMYAGETEKTIRLSTKFQGKYYSIQMELSDEQYRIACDAHKDEDEVEVAGLLDMSHHFWVLTEIEYFRMAQ